MRNVQSGEMIACHFVAVPFRAIAPSSVSAQVLPCNLACGDMVEGDAGGAPVYLFVGKPICRMLLLPMVTAFDSETRIPS